MGVFEIQTLVAIQKMRIMNFFVPNFGSPCCTQSSVIFSELKNSPTTTCWALRSRSSWRSHPSAYNFLRLFRTGFSVTLQTHTNTVPLTFLWHRPCSTDHKTFFLFSLWSSNGFLIACFLCFLSLRNRIVRNRGFKHCENTEQCSALVRGLREVGDILVRIVDERRVIIHGIILVDLFGLITCGVRGVGQVAKLLVLVRSALDLRFQVGEVRQDRVDRNVRWGRRGRGRSRSDRQGTARARTGETWEGRRWDDREMTTCALQTTLSLEPGMCVTRMRMCEVYAQCTYTRKMCLQQVSVYTPVAHTVVASTWVRTPVSTTLLLKNRTKKNSSLHDHLEKTSSDFLHVVFDLSLTRTWSTSLLSTNRQMCELMLLGFPRHALFFWFLMMPLCGILNLSSASSWSGISTCVRAFV